MKAFELKPSRRPHAAGLVACAIAAIALLAPPCLAQYPGQYPPASGQYPGAAAFGPATGQYPGAGRYAPSLPQTPAEPQVSLPPGVNKIIANEGNNHLLVMATPDGYANVLYLVRNLTGNLDIIRTKVVSVEATAEESGNLDLSKPVVNADAAAKLIAALQAGNLRPIETLRITTRENTPVDTLLKQRGRQLSGGGTPFTLVPREETDGSLTMQLIQPISTSVTVKSGQTAVIALPGSKSGEVQLLFMTPAIVPSNARTTR